MTTMAKKQTKQSTSNLLSDYIKLAFSNAGMNDKVKAYEQVEKMYAELTVPKYEKLIERIKYLTPGMFVSQLKEALEVAKGYYKNKRGEYIHMCGIEIYGNVSDLCRMGYNGEDRGVFPHWVLVDDHSITRIESPVIGFTKYFSNFVADDMRMQPTTKEDFEQAVQRAIQCFLTPYEDPDGIEPEQFLDWETKWIEYQRQYSQLTNEAMKLHSQKQIEQRAIEDSASD